MLRGGGQHVRTVTQSRRTIRCFPVLHATSIARGTWIQGTRGYLDTRTTALAVTGVTQEDQEIESSLFPLFCIDRVGGPHGSCTDRHDRWGRGDICVLGLNLP